MTVDDVLVSIWQYELFSDWCDLCGAWGPSVSEREPEYHALLNRMCAACMAEKLSRP